MIEDLALILKRTKELTRGLKRWHPSAEQPVTKFMRSDSERDLFSQLAWCLDSTPSSFIAHELLEVFVLLLTLPLLSRRPTSILTYPEKRQHRNVRIDRGSVLQFR
jgi:hypothetical protein